MSNDSKLAMSPALYGDDVQGLKLSLQRECIELRARINTAVEDITAIGAAGVTSFNARTGAVVPATNDYTWAQVDKSTSSIADITTRTHASLTALNADDHSAVYPGYAQAETISGAWTFSSTVTHTARIDFPKTYTNPEVRWNGTYATTDHYIRAIYYNTTGGFRFESDMNGLGFAIGVPGGNSLHTTINGNLTVESGKSVTMTGCAVTLPGQSNTHTPSGATAQQLEIYIGGTKYFIPAYAAAW